MSNVILAVYLILVGVTGLVATKLPEFVAPVAAIIAGLAVLGGSFKSSK